MHCLNPNFYYFPDSWWLHSTRSTNAITKGPRKDNLETIPENIFRAALWGCVEKEITFSAPGRMAAVSRVDRNFRVVFAAVSGLSYSS
ncbi:hypothetical protein X977_807 [Burkholderia pseudomallei MSHR7504]|nr:hypothetical protein X977_807 [Burkholderia pseudomallei MSHR7504]